MSKAQQIYDKRFAGHGTPRSTEYKDGFLYILRRRFGELEQSQQCPYPAGTNSADAWFAGCDEGHKAWQMAYEEELHG